MAQINHSKAEVATLVAELERRSKTAKDYIVPVSSIKMNANGEVEFPLGIGDAVTALPLSKTAHDQTAEKLGIPGAYYNRMLDGHGELLATNVNTWAAEQTGKNAMFRTLDDRIRAHVSDKFRALDSYDLFFATFGKLKAIGAETGTMPEISRCTLTDDRFEMRIIHPEWRTTINYPDGGDAPGAHQIRRTGVGEIIPGVYVSTSDTGKGGLNIKPFLLDAICSNGYIGEQAFSRVHLGSRNELGYLSSETIKARDNVLWLEVADLIGAVFDRERFDALIADMTGAASAELSKPVEAVDAVVSKYEMSDDDKQAILNELISPSHDRDPGRTVFGLMSAITERAKVYADSDPDRMTTLEEAGLDFMRNARELVAVR